MFLSSKAFKLLIFLLREGLYAHPVYQDAVKRAIESLRARIVQPVYIIGKCKFLATSKF
jgi:hypothetical protein